MIKLVSNQKQKDQLSKMEKKMEGKLAPVHPTETVHKIETLIDNIKKY